MRAINEIQRIQKANPDRQQEIEIRAYRKEIEILKSVLENKEAENTFLRQQLDKKSQEFARSSNAMIQSSNRGLTKQIAQLQNRVDSLLEANQKLRDENIEYRKRISRSIGESKRTQEAIPTTTRDFITSQKETIDKLEKELARQKRLLKKALKRIPFNQQSEIYNDDILE